MQNLILSINVVLPLFLNISLGYFSKIIGLVDSHSLKVMNNATFKTFLPLLLFYNVYNTKLDGTINVKIMIFAPACILLTCLIGFLLVPLMEKENRKRGVLIQCAFRSNFVLFGLPIVLSLFGNDGTGVTSLLIAVIVPMFNLLAVIVLEIYRGGKINYKNILKGIITNPLIIASAMGLLILILNIHVPKVLDKTVGDISKVATPLALFILGGSFEFKKIGGNLKQLVIGIASRLVIAPGIFIPIAIIMNFRNIELGTLMIMLSAPAAVSSFTMAEQMDGDGELAGQLVVLTSAISVFTIFIWIFVLKQLGYI